VRSAEQISRTASEWHDAQRAERENILRQLLAELRRARETNAPWYTWVVARRQGEHKHGLTDEQGRTVACPVPGCDHHRGCPSPHRTESARGPKSAPAGAPR